MFTYLYNTLLYIFVGILCCSGDYIVEKNKKHRFRVHLQCDKGFSDLVCRLSTDDQTVQFYENVQKILAQKKIHCRRWTCSKETGILTKISISRIHFVDMHDAGYDNRGSKKTHVDA